MKHNHFFAVTLIGLFVLGFAGCSNPDAKYTRVEGTITYNGVAVEGASVTFMPSSSDGEPASGTTDASGKYLLTSGGAEAGGRGALPGEYSVIVSKRETTVTDPDQEAYERDEITYEELERRRSGRDSYASAGRAKELLPEKYGQPHSTSLRATVSTDKVSTHNFDLTDD